MSSKYQFSRSFQEEIVALMFREPTFLPKYSQILSPAYFTKDDLTCLSRLILKHYQKYSQAPKHMDQLILDYASKLGSSAEESRSVAGPLLSLIDRLSAMDLSNFEYAVDRVQEFGLHQSFILGLQQAYEIATSGNGEDGRASYEDALAAVQRALSVGHGGNGDLATADLLDSLLEINQSVVKERVPTGYPSFDQALGGGPYAGEVYAFVAASGIGKSIVLENMLVNAVLTGNPAVLFTLELDHIQTLNRVAACLTGIPVHELENPTASTKMHYKNSIETLRRDCGGTLPFLIQAYSPKSASVSTLRSALSHYSATRNFRPKLIVIDYADELRAGSMYKGEAANTYLEMGCVYKELRAFGRDWSSPIITASQINRVSIKTAKSGIDVCDMDSLADSYAKVAVSDGVITMNQSNEEKLAGRMRWFIAKLRRGAGNQIIDIDIDYPTMRVSEAKVQFSHDLFFNRN